MSTCPHPLSLPVIEPITKWGRLKLQTIPSPNFTLVFVSLLMLFQDHLSLRSSVGTVTGLRPGNSSFITAGAKKNYSSLLCPDRLFSRGQSGRCVKPPFSFTYLLMAHFKIKYRHNFTFKFIPKHCILQNTTLRLHEMYLTSFTLIAYC